MTQRTAILVRFNDTSTRGRTGPSRILPGALTLNTNRPVFLLMEHRPTLAYGYVTDLLETDEDVRATITINDRHIGVAATVETAETGGCAPLSIGLEIIDSERVDGITIIKSAIIHEVSLTTNPAFASAKLTTAIIPTSAIEEEGAHQ